MSFRISKSLWDKIHHFASFLRLEQMVLFGQNPSQGTLLKASQFLLGAPNTSRTPCQRADQLPHDLSHMPSIKKVKDWYAQSFEELVHFPPIHLPPHLREALFVSAPNQASLPESTPNPSLTYFSEDYTTPSVASTSFSNGNGNSAHPTKRGYLWSAGSVMISLSLRYFANTSSIVWPPELIKKRHDPTVTTVAQGVLEWKRSRNARNINLDVQHWLDRFYLSRIGIRFLIGQHVALNTLQPHPIMLGSFAHDRPLLPLRPRHLSHIVFELLKNSLRAVVERYGPENEDHFPPIKVIVVEGKEDITIKISDEGEASPAARFHSFGRTCTPPWRVRISGRFPGQRFNAPMAGFGYGCHCQIARYFGGDLRLISMDGFGTDVYIHLNKLSSSAEPLP
ncbi:mitochondrial branched-chain alpha-ketoacid dehydrogenase kinase-domain-containing protein [Irpex lacteus]|nr:mitochondrial branched-chain alpha-ketoacid dehydrogenase kinase-domain-containing protein [Irpex lacteus]